MATDKFSRSVTGKVTATHRVGTSTMGNPTYDVVIVDADGDADVYRTSSNSGLAYGITNVNYRESAHTFGLTKAGRLNGYVK